MQVDAAGVPPEQRWFQSSHQKSLSDDYLIVLGFENSWVMAFASLIECSPQYFCRIRSWTPKI